MVTQKCFACQNEIFNLILFQFEANYFKSDDSEDDDICTCPTCMVNKCQLKGTQERDFEFCTFS
jgi:hypothetical protein